MKKRKLIGWAMATIPVVMLLAVMVYTLQESWQNVLVAAAVAAVFAGLIVMFLVGCSILYDEHN